MDMKLQQVQVLKPQLTQELSIPSRCLAIIRQNSPSTLMSSHWKTLLLNERKQTHRHYLTIKQTKTG